MTFKLHGAVSVGQPVLIFLMLIDWLPRLIKISLSEGLLSIHLPCKGNYFCPNLNTHLQLLPLLQLNQRQLLGKYVHTYCS